MTSLIAALASCDPLTCEIDSGTIHAIATKPVRCWCQLLGKWLGFIWLLTLHVLFIKGGSIPSTGSRAGIFFRTQLCRCG